MEQSTSDFIKRQNESSLFSFYEFPKSIQRDNLHVKNLIENNNKGFRHKAKRFKEQFPNEDSLERFACTVYCDYNRRFSGKRASWISRSISEYCWRCSRINLSVYTIRKC